MVAFRAVPRPAVPVRAWAAVAFLAAAFVPGAFLAVAFVPGAFFVVALVVGAFFAVAFAVAVFLAVAFIPGALAAVAFGDGRRVGAAVAEVLFFCATRAVVGVGFSPGLFAALAPVARFVAAATFLAATFRGIGVPFALLGLVTPVDLVSGVFTVRRARSAISFLLDQRAIRRAAAGRIG